MKTTYARTRRAAAPSTAFPTKQLFVLALCRLCEPVAFMSIFPYVYHMVASFHITDDEKRISLYAGMVTSVFAFAEFSTSVIWGRLSDRFGRKPILLCGLAGTGISILAFGFSPNLTTALIARALGGLLNGNIGVLVTTVAEVVTEEKHKPRAFSIMPAVWCIGSIIGSALGGLLADPVRSYPGHFAPDSIFAKFPFLLPNMVCACLVVLSMTVGILFLEETHEDKLSRRDYGLEIGDRILDLFRRVDEDELDEKRGLSAEESESLLADAEKACSSTGSSPTLAPLSMPAPKQRQHQQDAVQIKEKRPSLCSVMTRQISLLIVSYGIIAYHTISAEQLLPIMLSLPKMPTPIRLPFIFSAGFQLSTKTIGSILSMQGLVQTFAALLFFPMVSAKLGTLRTFRLAIFSYPLLYVIIPFLNVAPAPLRIPGLCLAIVWKVFAQAFVLPSLQIMIAGSVPSKKVLGTINGAAASSACLCRSFGPTVSGFIQSAGLSFGCLGLPWWTSSIVAMLGIALSLLVEEPQPKTATNEKNALDSAEAQKSFPALDELENGPDPAALGGLGAHVELDSLSTD